MRQKEKNYKETLKYFNDDHLATNVWVTKYALKDKKGNFYFGGRKDSLIIKGGENIYPSEIENAITTYKFEEAVFRRAPTYTDIRIQLDEISLQAEMLYENLGKLYPGARSFLLQSHIFANKDYKYLAKLISGLETLTDTSQHSVESLKGKKGRPINAFGMLLIAQLARSCLKNTDINPSQNNSTFMGLVLIIGEAVANNNLKDIVGEALEQVGQ